MTRLYGFKVRDVPGGGRGPDCPVAIRWALHHATRAAFYAVPCAWMRAPGWRMWVWDEVLAAFGWWGYSHED